MIEYPINVTVPRTGGTLIYNIMNYIFDTKVERYHAGFIKNKTNKKIISSYRDMRNSLISNIVWDANLVNEMTIKNYMAAKIKSAINLNELKKQYSTDQILFLKYESFRYEFENDFDYIFNLIEPFLQIKIPNDKKIYIRNNFNVVQLKNKLCAAVVVGNKKNPLVKIENTTNFHKRHISDYVIDWKSLPVDLSIFDSLNFYLTEWGYEIYDKN